MADTAAGGFSAQFLRGGAGDLFLLTYPGFAQPQQPRRALVVVPAFAEEMNKARRQVALLGRALAAHNITTIVPDLYGTGDSDGDFGDTSVELWRENLQRVFAWAADQGFEAVGTLGVRAGALLLVDLLNHTDLAPAPLLLWQPVVSGKTMISQFLRLKAAASLTQETRGEGVRELRARLATDEAVEVAGYWLAPELVAQFDALHLRDLPATSGVHWFQVQDGAEPPPAARTVIDKLDEKNIEVAFEAVGGEPFWSTVEISLAPDLIERSAQMLAAT